MKDLIHELEQATEGSRLMNGLKPGWLLKDVRRAAERHEVFTAHERALKAREQAHG